MPRTPIAITMALNPGRQEALESEGENNGFHVLYKEGTSEQNKKQDVQFCRICFATDGNLFSMKMDKNLNQAYQTLTGLSTENDNDMPPYLCSECSHQVMHCIRFRTRSLQAHLHLLEILKEHDCITIEMIKSVSACRDVNILNCDVTHNPTDKYDLESIVVKEENVDIDEDVCVKDEPNSVEDVYSSIKTEDDYIFNRDSPNYEDAMHLSRLHEDTVGEVKGEIDEEYNIEGVNNGEIPSDDMICSDGLDGDDEPDYCIPVDKQGPKASMNITEVKEVTKLNASTKLHRCKSTTNIRKQVKSSGIRFCCPLCGKTFTTKWGLQKHTKVHTGERPYLCDVCQRSFRENRDLQNHLRTHSGEKPFDCDLCKKSFSERGNLLRHIRIHAGEKPFSCRICKISFNQKHHLKRHLTRHF